MGVPTTCVQPVEAIHSQIVGVNQLQPSQLFLEVLQRPVNLPTVTGVINFDIAIEKRQFQSYVIHRSTARQ